MTPPETTIPQCTAPAMCGCGVHGLPNLLVPKIKTSFAKSYLAPLKLVREGANAEGADRYTVLHQLAHAPT